LGLGLHLWAQGDYFLWANLKDPVVEDTA